MAVRRKRKKATKKRTSFELGIARKKTRPKIINTPIFTSILKRLGLICLFAAIVVIAALGIAVGFLSLDRYVRTTTNTQNETSITVELVNPPAWINEHLREKIYNTILAKNIKLKEDTARLVQENLKQEIAWLQKVTVRTTHNKIIVEAVYRKPIALVKSGLQKFYVDTELVVLDYLPMQELSAVEVKGLPLVTRTPPVGKVWQRDDLAAAVAILERLDRMDSLVSPDKPLLGEIKSIDMINFKGRENKRAPHIILYAKDNTVIIWGAELSAWAQHLEATDKEKLAKLYQYYKEYGTLLGGVKYINLRDPRGNIPLPIDKY
jgi:hypothetical protein